MKQLRHIRRVIGSNVEELTFVDDWDSKKYICVRRNLLPVMITCEAIQSDLNCVYKNPRTRECMFRMGQNEYAFVPVELVKALREMRNRGFED